MPPPYPAEVEQFVEEYVFQMLDALRASRQLEERYAVLNRTTKSATSRELRELSRKAARYILDNVANIEALADLDDDSLVREALTRALQEEDNGEDGNND